MIRDRIKRFLGLDVPLNGATLTFLPDGRVILGLPENCSQSMAYHIGQDLQKWLAESDSVRPAVFPFPVHVVDMRA